MDAAIAMLMVTAFLSLGCWSGWYGQRHPLERNDGPMTAQLNIKQLFVRLEQLPPERVAEVEDFIDFLGKLDGDPALVRASRKAP